MDAGAAPLLLAALRVWLGALFVAHGLEKLFGAFGGQGRAAWRTSVERQGFRPAGLFALLLPVGELVCGPLLALGLGTGLAAGFLSTELVVAIRKIHGPKGFFNFKGGWEFQATLLAALAMFGLGGAGTLSLDAVAGVPFGPASYLASFGLGLLVALPGLLRPAAASTGRWTAGGAS